VIALPCLAVKKFSIFGPAGLIFPFSGKKAALTPSAIRFLCSAVSVDISKFATLISYHSLTPKMPMTNGDVTSDGVPLIRGQSIHDYTKAEELLQAEYKVRDGMDVKTLLDPNKNGALTYNDFLVLPGYIGTGPALRVGLIRKTDQMQASQHQM
jgi:hypothetical protein